MRNPRRRDVPADVGLGVAGLHQGEAGAAFGRGALARPVVAEVVEVHPEDDGGLVGGGQGSQGAEKARLAVVAAIGVVGAVGGVGDLRPWATSRQRSPHSAARARQSSSSSGANDADTAVTHRTAPRPRVSVATRARKAESAPPLKATTTRPSAPEHGRQPLEPARRRRRVRHRRCAIGH